MTRHAFTLAVLLALGLAAGLATARADDPPPPVTLTTTVTETVTSSYEGHAALWWAGRARGWHKRATGLRRTLLHRGTVTEALGLACVVYGHCGTLWRRAGCESGYDAGAVNQQGQDSPAGLLQFKPSTWRTTPFARLSVFSAYANALAAGWMEAHGRGGEFACR